MVTGVGHASVVVTEIINVEVIIMNGSNKDAGGSGLGV